MITMFICGSDAVCGDATGLEARYLLDMIAEDERRREGREGEAPGVVASERAGRGCVLCGDEEAPTIDEVCAGCLGHEEPVDFCGYGEGDPS